MPPVGMRRIPWTIIRDIALRRFPEPLQVRCSPKGSVLEACSSHATKDQANQAPPKGPVLDELAFCDGMRTVEMSTNVDQ